MPVIDIHTHAFPDMLAPSAMASLSSGTKWYPVETFHDATINGLLAGMDRAGIDQAVICSIATRPTQTPKINDWSAAIASDRLIPFSSIHPDCPDPEAQVAKIATAGLRGIKFHSHYMNCAVDDPRCIRIARAIADAGLVMLFHAGYDLSFDCDQLASPRQFRLLHEAVPQLKLVAAHLGGWERWSEVLEHLAGLPVYLDTSYSLPFCPKPILKELFNRHSADYIVFGSDSPWVDQKKELQAVRQLPLTSDQLEKILWHNTRRLLGF